MPFDANPISKRTNMTSSYKHLVRALQVASKLFVLFTYIYTSAIHFIVYVWHIQEHRKIFELSAYQGFRCSNFVKSYWKNTMLILSILEYFNRLKAIINK